MGSREFTGHTITEDPLNAPFLNLEQDAEAERLFQTLRLAVEAELRRMTRLLASKPGDKLLGY
jgi:hypothetical protein